MQAYVSHIPLMYEGVSSIFTPFVYSCKACSPCSVTFLDYIFCNFYLPPCRPDSSWSRSSVTSCQRALTGQILINLDMRPLRRRMQRPDWYSDPKESWEEVEEQQEQKRSHSSRTWGKGWGGVVVTEEERREESGKWMFVRFSFLVDERRQDLLLRKFQEPSILVPLWKRPLLPSSLSVMEAKTSTVKNDLNLLPWWRTPNHPSPPVKV